MILNKIEVNRLFFNLDKFETALLTYKRQRDNIEFDNLPWITEDAKKSLINSVDLSKKSRNDFKKAVEDGYRKFEQLLKERESEKKGE